MKPFSNPRDTLRGLDADQAAIIVCSAADVSVMVDAEGAVLDVGFSADELPADFAADWIGRRFADTITTETRDKVRQILEEAASSRQSRWRHIDHVLASGAELAMLYRGVALGSGRGTLLLGRDQSSAVRLQQRLVDAQQSLERDYSRLRHVETRYRLLFQIASDPVLVVDAASQRVLEANPAATAHFGGDGGRVVGTAFPQGFDTASTRAVEAMLAGVRTTGRPDEITAGAAEGDARFVVSAALFRQEATALFLVRLTAGAASVVAANPIDARVVQAINAAPDAFALTTNEGRIVHVNAAFVDLTQLASTDQALGETLERWVGRSSVDLNVMFANLRERGNVKLFATELRGEHGVTTDVEISAAALDEAGKSAFGFVIRNVGRRLQHPPAGSRALPHSVDQLTELVGRVSLKDVVRETTDMIERLYIEAALSLTGNNRASAAELLGLSRQSLYVKLHRYGLRDGDGDDDGREGNPA